MLFCNIFSITKVHIIFQLEAKLSWQNLRLLFFLFLNSFTFN